MVLLSSWQDQPRTGSLALSVSSQFRMLASLTGQYSLRAAVGLSTVFFLVWACLRKIGLSLSTVATPVPCLNTAFPGHQRILVLLVLYLSVGLALVSFLAESLAGLRDVHHVVWVVLAQKVQPPVSHLSWPLVFVLRTFYPKFLKKGSRV